jgi:transposase
VDVPKVPKFKCILAQIEPNPVYNFLCTVTGIGEVLAQTILLETGEISRFKAPGNFASFAVAWIVAERVTARKRVRTIGRTVVVI